MPVTRIFRNGNSQAIRIPAELAYPEAQTEVEIERFGDALRIRPIRRSFANERNADAAVHARYQHVLTSLASLIDLIEVAPSGMEASAAFGPIR